LAEIVPFKLRGYLTKMVSLRLANDSDNAQLLDLERMCPQGTSLVLSFDRSPDFFSRSRVYKDYKIYVAEEDKKVVGTVGVTTKKLHINGEPVKSIYIYDLRVNPAHRGKHTGSQLVQHAIAEEGEADLAYGVTMEDNYPSVALFRKLGFSNVHNLTLFSIPVFKRKDHIALEARAMVSEDTPQVVNLLNRYYNDYDFFAKLTEDGFLERTKNLPGYGLTNIQVVETENKIQACVGLWDYSEIFTVTALHVSTRLAILRYILKFINAFKNTMQLPSVGEPFKLLYVRDFAFSGKADTASELIKHCLSLTYSYHCNFLTFALDPADLLIPMISKYSPIRVGYQIYGKGLKDKILQSSRMVYVDPMDL